MGLGWEILPEIAGAVVQYLIANLLLDAQKDARERLGALAFENLELAEELFEDTMILRAYDQQVYDHMKGLPGYSACIANVERGRITGHFQQAELIKRGAFGHSRYNCGNREEAIGLALSASLLTAGEQMANAHNFEEMLEDLYDTLRWTSITTSAAFSEFNPAGVFGSVADQLAKQDAALGAAAGGALAALGYTAKGLVRDIFTVNDSRGQVYTQTITSGGTPTVQGPPR